MAHLGSVSSLLICHVRQHFRTTVSHLQRPCYLFLTWTLDGVEHGDCLLEVSSASVLHLHRAINTLLSGLRRLHLQFPDKDARGSPKADEPQWEVQGLEVSKRSRNAHLPSGTLELDHMCSRVTQRDTISHRKYFPVQTLVQARTARFAASAHRDDFETPSVSAILNTYFTALAFPCFRFVRAC
jgi:hypothetical protein